MKILSSNDVFNNVKILGRIFRLILTKFIRFFSSLISIKNSRIGLIMYFSILYSSLRYKNILDLNIRLKPISLKLIFLYLRKTFFNKDFFNTEN